MHEHPVHRKTRTSFDDPGHAHELTFSCFRRRAFLSKERTCRYLAEAILRARRQHQFALWAYVFMPEHVHLLIWPTQACYSIAAIRKSIKQSVARRATSWLRAHSPAGLRSLATGHSDIPYQFWMEGGGYDRNVTLAKTLRPMVDYIHNNPVRRGLVAQPEDWYWSSARAWAGLGDDPLPIDRDCFPPFWAVTPKGTP